MASTTAVLSLALMTAGGPWPPAGADGVSDGDSVEAPPAQEAPAPSQDGMAGGVSDGSSGSLETPDGFNPLPDQVAAQSGSQPLVEGSQSGGEPLSGSGDGSSPGGEHTTSGTCGEPAV